MAEKPDEEVVSTQQRLQSSHDPGWNDPPKWAFTPTPITSGTPTRRLLNKRVAFPLASTPFPENPTALGQSLPPSSFPPPPSQLPNRTTAPHAPLLAPTVAVNALEITPLIGDKEDGLNKTLGNIQSVINSQLDDTRTEEVQKRMEMMKNMWISGKLNDEIQGKVLKISEALRDRDIDTADKLHVSLMIEHNTLCNNWISGIRHLILELRSKATESEGIADINSQPVFLLNPTESK
ncbi:steroid receptor RNA activator 1-like [Fopius arisanus]|uniref:Steroid receptor RNA activator 1-like n=1 Tax=Fopius arisanus TaxID=64838 RepID=A0A9R1TU34_9HYME|nr:PREDICTED: steroid receptor RNA activator 1-like [Fopius arisanus]